MRSSRICKGKETRDCRETLREIEEHPETKLLDNEDFADAFGYVGDLFPRIRATLRSIRLLKNTNTCFCRNVGLGGVAGAFLTRVNAIVVCHSEHVPDDVIVVHEILHYAARLLGGRMTNEGQEEDFAFIKSIPFIVAKGYDKDWIIERYLAPYYSRRVRKDADADEATRDKCERIYQDALLSNYNKKTYKSGTRTPSRFEGL